jgi:hypothetical protein
VILVCIRLILSLKYCYTITLYVPRNEICRRLPVCDDGFVNERVHPVLRGTATARYDRRVIFVRRSGLSGFTNGATEGGGGETRKTKREKKNNKTERGRCDGHTVRVCDKRATVCVKNDTQRTLLPTDGPTTTGALITNRDGCRSLSLRRA